MDGDEFDTALMTTFFRLVAEQGWRRAAVAAAAREAGLSVSEARGRFPDRGVVLLRFGRLLDQRALLGVSQEGPVRDRLFDLLMTRFEALQPYRAGVLALLRALPMEPPVTLLLTCATKRSMRWMLQAAGVPAGGLRGRLEVDGLFAVWLWVLRTWERDESADLSATMAALDTTLARAERAAAWFGGNGRTQGGSERASGSDEIIPPGEAASDPPAN